MPLVILSGYAEFEYARSAIQLGVCEYGKPLNVKQFTGLLARLENFWTSAKAPRKTPGPAADPAAGNLAIRRVEEYVAGHLGEDLSLATVAARVNLSTNYLSMLFRSTTSQKVQRIRAAHAYGKSQKLLAQSEFKIYEIAEICGYNSVKHLYQRF